MSKVIHLTSLNLDVLDSGIVVLDFFAEWCRPCRQLGPILEDLSETVGDEVKIVKVNVDELKDLARQYRIQAIPTIFILKDKQIVGKLQGLQHKETLLQEIEKVRQQNAYA